MQPESGESVPSSLKFKESIRARLLVGFVLMMGATLAIGSVSVLAVASSRSAILADGTAILVFSAVAMIGCFMAVPASRRLARRITTPISALTESADRIARGDYATAIEAAGKGELSLLTGSFEKMRRKINEQMEDLQMQAEDKRRQARTLLENIDQGFFSFDLDLRINEDCSRKAMAILRMEKMEGRRLAEALRLDLHQEGLFRDWLEIVRESTSRLRWHKLSRLVPLQELRMGEGESSRLLQFEYRKILNNRERLSGILVFIHDVTESRKVERRLSDEKIRHEHKVKIILGVARHTQETMVAFLDDCSCRLLAIRQRLEAIQCRASETDPKNAVAMDESFRDCHTVKGNSGAFGFDGLTQAAQELEALLEARDPDKAPGLDPAGLAEMTRLVDSMSAETERIHEVHLLLSGNSEEVSVRLPERKVARIRELAEMVGKQTLSPEMSDLIETCKRLSYRSLESLSGKYRELVSRAAFKLGKTVEFTISPLNIEVDPEALLRVDEALIHLLRNAVAHGIELPELRLRSGKGMGKVELSYERASGTHIFMVRDDGQGVDTDALAEKAVKKGILPRASFSGLGSKEKLNLLFHPGLSATAMPDTLSGSGLGMSIANDAVRALGGSLSVETHRGEGSRITISIPV